MQNNESEISFGVKNGISPSQYNGLSVFGVPPPNKLIISVSGVVHSFLFLTNECINNA